MIRLGCLLLVLCSSPPLEAGTPKPLLDVAGWGLVFDAGTILVLGERFLHVAAYDRDGGQRWRVPYQERAEGTQSLQFLGSQGFLYAGRTLRTVDLGQGRLGPSLSVPYMQGTYGETCTLAHTKGACALQCTCNTQLVNCATGAFIGPRHSYVRKCISDFDGGGQSCSCYGEGATLLGRVGHPSGALVVMHFDGVQSPKAGSKGAKGRGVLAAFEATTGEEVWRKQDGLLRPTPYVNGTGITPDGRTCWLGNAGGALMVFDCATGRRLWQIDARRKEYMPASRIAAYGDSSSIFFFRTGEAMALDARTGARRWTIPVPQDVASVLPFEGLADGPWRPRPSAPGSVWLVSGTDGSHRVTLPLETQYGTIQRYGQSLLVQDGDTFAVYGVDGQRKHHREMGRIVRVALGKTLLAVCTTKELIVLDPANFEIIARWPGTYELVALEGTLGEKRLLVYRPGKDGQPDRVRLFQL